MKSEGCTKTFCHYCASLLIRWLGLGCCEPPICSQHSLKGSAKREGEQKVKSQNKKEELLLNAASPWQLCNLLASEQQRPRVSQCATRLAGESFRNHASQQDGVCCVCVCVRSKCWRVQSMFVSKHRRRQNNQRPRDPRKKRINSRKSPRKIQTLPSGPAVQNPPRGGAGSCIYPSCKAQVHTIFKIYSDPSPPLFYKCKIIFSTISTSPRLLVSLKKKKKFSGEEKCITV